MCKIAGRTYVLNNERTSKVSPRTAVTPLGSTDNAITDVYIAILDRVEFVVRRIARGKGIDGIVMSIAGMISIRLAALEMAISAFVPWPGVLGKFSDRENRHMGNTSATATATLAAINALKERRRGRFVTVEGTAPRREAYRGSVHDDEKINAVELIPCQRMPKVSQ
jgi:hypothetical protein